LWSYIKSDIQQYLNPFYKPTENVIFPGFSLKKLKFWENYYLRIPSFVFSVENRGKEMFDEMNQHILFLQEEIKRLGGKTPYFPNYSQPSFVFNSMNNNHNFFQSNNNNNNSNQSKETL
jgi:hypothetical protein